MENQQKTRLKLLHRIGRHYRTKAVSIQLGRLELPFVRIAEPDRVLDDLVEQEDRRSRLPEGEKTEPPRMPYWAELWDSSLALGQWVVRNLGEDQSVLDLGCGMGLAGAAAAAVGAKVFLADLETPALLLARLNTLPWLGRTRVRRVNWQTDCLGEKFDCILGADILYEVGQWSYLDAFWRRHLAEDGKVVLAEPARGTADAFAAWGRERGWIVEEASEPVATMQRPARIFGLRQQKGAGQNKTPAVS